MAYSNTGIGPVRMIWVFQNKLKIEHRKLTLFLYERFLFFYFYSIFKVSTCSPILHFFVWGFKQWIVKLHKQLNVIIASNDQGKNQSTEPLIID